MKKILDSFIGEVKIEDQTDANGVKRYIISGVCMYVDKPNENDRVYPRGNFEPTLKRFQEKVKNRQKKMSVDHPDYGSGKLDSTGAGLIEVSDIQPDGSVLYKAQIFDTTKGSNLKKILDAGWKVGVSLRGYGSALYDQDWPGHSKKVSIIQADYELENIDFVETPAVEDTELTMQLENKNKEKETVKTIEMLRKEFPEAFVDFDKKTADEKTTMLASLTEANGKVEKFTKMFDTIKASLPELFQTIVLPETEATKVKDAEIKDLKLIVVDSTKKVSEVTEKLNKIQNDAVVTAKKSLLDSLKATDKDTFALPGMEGRFDACLTAEEVQAVYNSTKELLDSYKKANPAADPGKKTPEEPKTKTPEAPAAPDIKLDAKQQRDFDLKNEQRRYSRQQPMTLDQYQKAFITK